jgi:hypothetical protein
LVDYSGFDDFFVVGTMMDIIEGKYQFGLSKEYKGIVLMDGDLMELDVLYFIFGLLEYVEGHPMSEFLAKVGIFEIMKEVKKKYLDTDARVL